MNDTVEGILTDTELRQKLVEVDDDAAIATPEVQAAARKMLRAITQDERDTFMTSIVEMSDACKAAGW